MTCLVFGLVMFKGFGDPFDPRFGLVFRLW